MGARSGNNYLSAMRKLKPRIRLEGEPVPDPITHLALARHARLIASLYDAQIEHPGLMTYRLADGDRIGWSFVQPASVDEVRKRGLMLRAWAEQSAHSPEPTPDWTNVMLATMAAASDFFRAADAQFAANLRSYYEEARRRDWCIAMTDVDASQGRRAATYALASPPVQMRRVDAGFVISGVAPLACSGGLADEVFLLWEDSEYDGSAFLGAIPSNSRGLSFECERDASAENSALLRFRLICENVLLPTTRIFLDGSGSNWREVEQATGVATNLKYLAVIKNLAQARQKVAASASAPTADRAVVDQWRTTLNEIDAHLRAAENRAQPDRWGQFIPLEEPLERAAGLLRTLNPAG